MFETTEPAIVPRTTFGSPSEIAKRAMISSGALPKLAFRKPPTPWPVCSAACSVASPINQASGSSASAASTNSAVGPACRPKRATTATGVRASDAQRILRATSLG